MDKQQTSTTTTVHMTVPFVSGEALTDLLEGELVFDAADPYAVTMHLEAKAGRVTWTFARDLLAEGLYDPAGDGDVQVWPCLSGAGEAVVIIELLPHRLGDAPDRFACDPDLRHLDPRARPDRPGEQPPLDGRARRAAARRLSEVFRPPCRFQLVDFVTVVWRESP